MSYATSSALQVEIYNILQSNTGVSSIVNGHVYDALPSGNLPGLYVLIGAEEARDRSDQTTAAVLYLLTLSIVSDSAGFADAKAAAGAVCDALLQTPAVLTRGVVVGRWFDRAVAKQLKSGGREVRLRFRFYVEDDMRN